MLPSSWLRLRCLLAALRFLHDRLKQPAHQMQRRPRKGSPLTALQQIPVISSNYPTCPLRWRRDKLTSQRNNDAYHNKLKRSSLHHPLLQLHVLQPRRICRAPYRNRCLRNRLARSNPHHRRPLLYSRLLLRCSRPRLSRNKLRPPSNNSFPLCSKPQPALCLDSLMMSDRLWHKQQQTDRGRDSIPSVSRFS